MSQNRHAKCWQQLRFVSQITAVFDNIKCRTLRYFRLTLWGFRPKSQTSLPEAHVFQLKTSAYTAANVKSALWKIFTLKNVSDDLTCYMCSVGMSILPINYVFDSSILKLLAEAECSFFHFMSTGNTLFLLLKRVFTLWYMYAVHVRRTGVRRTCIIV